MKKVLAFFGAFNPPTTAHLELADFARKATGREGVIFVPSRAAYIRGFQQKDGAYSDAVRLEMLETLAKTRPWMRVCSWELEQETQPRSYVTLCHLREEGYAPSLLVGSDNLKVFSGWKYVPEIAREFGIVCLDRGQDSCREIIENDPVLKSLAEYIEVPEIPGTWRDISSTAVRSRIRDAGDAEERFRALPPEIRHLAE